LDDREEKGRGGGIRAESRNLPPKSPFDKQKGGRDPNSRNSVEGESTWRLSRASGKGTLTKIVGPRGEKENANRSIAARRGKENAGWGPEKKGNGKALPRTVTGGESQKDSEGGRRHAEIGRDQKKDGSITFQKGGTAKNPTISSYLRENTCRSPHQLFLKRKGGEKKMLILPNIHLLRQKEEEKGRRGTA